MADAHFNDDWVDRYVRDQLDDAECEAFELALMESSELQQRVETALALQQALRVSESSDDQSETPVVHALEPVAPLTSGRWQGLALTASLALAVFSTVMFWRVSQQAHSLEAQLVALQQPFSDVLEVPVNIMRSGPSGQPDLVVQKPPADTLLRLNIELHPEVRELETVTMMLSDASGRELLSWSAYPNRKSRVMALLSPTALPDGQVRLDMSEPGGATLDSRLLEFRPLTP